MAEGYGGSGVWRVGLLRFLDSSSHLIGPLLYLVIGRSLRIHGRRPLRFSVNDSLDTSVTLLTNSPVFRFMAVVNQLLSFGTRPRGCCFLTFHSHLWKEER